MDKLFNVLAFIAFIGFSSSSHAITLQQFVQLEREQQGFYLMGVLDSEVIDASYGAERSKCVQNWGLQGAYSYITEWYNRAPDDKNNLSFNVALIVMGGISQACGSNDSRSDEQ